VLPAAFPAPTELFYAGQGAYTRVGNQSFPLLLTAAKKLLYDRNVGLGVVPTAFSQFSAFCLAGNAAALATWNVTVGQCTYVCAWAARCLCVCTLVCKCMSHHPYICACPSASLSLPTSPFACVCVYRVFLGYVTAVIPSSYTDSFMQTAIFNQQGGLIVTRNVSSVLFGATDPLLKYLTPLSPSFGYFKNNRPEAPGFTTMQTGKNDRFQVQGAQQTDKEREGESLVGRCAWLFAAEPPS
jgi:hypothetical protein